ncbi:MAG: prepilin-type N-terminal cleavage/methylation domain-containing protein [Gemmatimonadaceae bacterium]
MKAIALRRRCNNSIHPALRPAFTLLELMVVVVIAGTMMAIAIPRVDTSKYRADAVVQIVRTTLQNASRTAVTQQHDMIVSFDTVGQNIRIVSDTNNNATIDPGERVTHRSLDQGILFTDPSVTGVGGASVSAPITGSAIKIMDGMPTLTFHRDGSVSSDAEIYVSIPAHGPKLYRALVLTQATGRIDWYRLNTSTNKWVLAGL